MTSGIREQPEPTSEPRGGDRLRSTRLFALFLLGCLLFGLLLPMFLSSALGSPELSLQARLVLGIPLPLALVFVTWALFIALIALLTEPGRPDGD